MSVLLGAIESKTYSNANLHKFLSKLKEQDFNGSRTKKSIKSKAKKFLEEKNYDDYETFSINGEKHFIHSALISLIYDNI